MFSQSHAKQSHAKQLLAMQARAAEMQHTLTAPANEGSTARRPKLRLGATLFAGILLFTLSSVASPAPRAAAQVEVAAECVMSGNGASGVTQIPDVVNVELNQTATIMLAGTSAEAETVLTVTANQVEGLLELNSTLLGDCQIVFEPSPGFEGTVPVRLTKDVNGSTTHSVMFLTVRKELPETFETVIGESFAALPLQGTYELISGDMPDGVSLENNGALTGTPTEPGDYTIVVQVAEELTGVTTHHTVLLRVGFGLLAYTGAETRDLGLLGSGLLGVGAVAVLAAGWHRRNHRADAPLQES